MTTNGYTFLGWIVWQLGSRLAKRQIQENRAKLGAVGVIALVLVAGAAAAKSSGD